MNRLASVAVGAVLIVACGTSSPTPAAIAPASDVRDSQDDILDRRIAIKAEIRELGPDHPWAGTYYAGDGTGINVTLTVAPRLGCVATWYGCMGLYGVNYGPVTTDGSAIHIAFVQPNTPGTFGHFDCDYTIESTGEDVRLVTDPRSVLMVVSPGGLSREEP